MGFDFWGKRKWNKFEDGGFQRVIGNIEGNDTSGDKVSVYLNSSE